MSAAPERGDSENVDQWVRRLAQLESAHRKLLTTLGRDPLEDLAHARELTEAAKNLEAAVLLRVRETDVTFAEMGDRLGISSQAVHKSVRIAERRLSSGGMSDTGPAVPDTGLA